MSVAACTAAVPYDGRGVVYFSSVPRNMRPTEIRLHFRAFGDITRMRFLAYPKKERRPGGALLPLQFKEGWLEFARAADAAAAARAMNATAVDCKRQRRCYGQLWTVKYLDGFAWDELAEQREAARRLRRMADAEARREERDVNEAYRRLVLQARPHRSSKAKKTSTSSHDNNDNDSRDDADRHARRTDTRTAASAKKSRTAEPTAAAAAATTKMTTLRTRRKRAVVAAVATQDGTASSPTTRSRDATRRRAAAPRAEDTA